jgi:hypothetical protein
MSTFKPCCLVCSMSIGCSCPWCYKNRWFISRTRQVRGKDLSSDEVDISLRRRISEAVSKILIVITEMTVE